MARVYHQFIKTQYNNNKKYFLDKFTLEQCLINNFCFRILGTYTGVESSVREYTKNRMISSKIYFVGWTFQFESNFNFLFHCRISSLNSLNLNGLYCLVTRKWMLHHKPSNFSTVCDEYAFIICVQMILMNKTLANEHWAPLGCRIKSVDGSPKKKKKQYASRLVISSWVFNLSD